MEKRHPNKQIRDKNTRPDSGNFDVVSELRDEEFKSLQAAPPSRGGVDESKEGGGIEEISLTNPVVSASGAAAVRGGVRLPPISRREKASFSPASVRSATVLLIDRQESVNQLCSFVRL